MAKVSRPSQWYLNDEVVNDYMKLLMQEYPDVYCFDTFFFTQFTKYGYEKVERWTRKVNIFSKRILLVPINISQHKFNHWVLICVNVVRKSIIYYDSLKMKPHAIQCMSHVSHYLCKEHRTKLGTELPLEDWSYPVVNNPLQSNSMDCGVFLCTFAEYLCRDAQFNFEQEHIVSFRQLILYELTTKRLVNVDVPISQIAEFIKKIVDGK